MGKNHRAFTFSLTEKLRMSQKDSDVAYLLCVCAPSRPQMLKMYRNYPESHKLDRKEHKIYFIGPENTIGFHSPAVVNKFILRTKSKLVLFLSKKKCNEYAINTHAQIAKGKIPDFRE